MKRSTYIISMIACSAISCILSITLYRAIDSKHNLEISEGQSEVYTETAFGTQTTEEEKPKIYDVKISWPCPDYVIGGKDGSKNLQWSYRLSENSNGFTFEYSDVFPERNLTAGFSKEACEDIIDYIISMDKEEYNPTHPNQDGVIVTEYDAHTIVLSSTLGTYFKVSEDDFNRVVSMLGSLYTKAEAAKG